MEVTPMPTRFTEQSQRFRPNSNEEQVLQKAREHFEATLIGVQGELAGSGLRSVHVPFAAPALRSSWGGNAGSVR